MAAFNPDMEVKPGVELFKTRQFTELINDGNEFFTYLRNLPENVTLSSTQTQQLAAEVVGFAGNLVKFAQSAKKEGFYPTALTEILQAFKTQVWRQTNFILEQKDLKVTV